MYVSVVDGADIISLPDELSLFTKLHASDPVGHELPTVVPHRPAL